MDELLSDKEIKVLQDAMKGVKPEGDIMQDNEDTLHYEKGTEEGMPSAEDMKEGFKVVDKMFNGKSMDEKKRELRIRFFILTGKSDFTPYEERLETELIRCEENIETAMSLAKDLDMSRLLIRELIQRLQITDKALSLLMDTPLQDGQRMTVEAIFNGNQKVMVHAEAIAERR